MTELQKVKLGELSPREDEFVQQVDRLAPIGYHRMLGLIESLWSIVDPEGLHRFNAKRSPTTDVFGRLFTFTYPYPLRVSLDIEGQTDPKKFAEYAEKLGIELKHTAPVTLEQSAMLAKVRQWAADHQLRIVKEERVGDVVQVTVEKVPYLGGWSSEGPLFGYSIPNVGQPQGPAAEITPGTGKIPDVVLEAAKHRTGLVAMSLTDADMTGQTEETLRQVMQPASRQMYWVELTESELSLLRRRLSDEKPDDQALRAKLKNQTFLQAYGGNVTRLGGSRLADNWRDLLSDGALSVMQRANAVALRLGHGYVGTEHILLGLIEPEPDGAVSSGTKLLRNIGVLNFTVADVEKLVADYTGVSKDVVVMGLLPLTPGAKKVAAFACEFAGAGKADEDALIFGMLRESSGVACIVLSELGLTLTRFMRTHQPVEPVIPRQVFDTETAIDRAKLNASIDVGKLDDESARKDFEEQPPPFDVT